MGQSTDHTIYFTLTEEKVSHTFNSDFTLKKEKKGKKKEDKILPLLKKRAKLLLKTPASPLSQVSINVLSHYADFFHQLHYLKKKLK